LVWIVGIEPNDITLAICLCFESSLTILFSEAQSMSSSGCDRLGMGELVQNKDCVGAEMRFVSLVIGVIPVNATPGCLIAEGK
jgi:hypothetical protein